MDCQTAINMIDPYLDGELEKEICLEFQKHVDGCPSCRTQFRSSKKSVNLMQLVFSDSAPPADMKHKLMDKLRSG